MPDSHNAVCWYFVCICVRVYVCCGGVLTNRVSVPFYLQPIHPSWYDSLSLGDIRFHQIDQGNRKCRRKLNSAQCIDSNQSDTRTDPADNFQWYYSHLHCNQLQLIYNLSHMRFVCVCVHERACPCSYNVLKVERI